NWFVGTALGIKGDEGNATLDIDGVDITLNENTNKTTGINNGTSTGAITIGSTTSGTLAFDTTSGITMNADDSIAVTTSAGTIDIDSTGGDLGIDATDKSILIDSGEAAADDAIIIVTTGAGSGMQITSLADIDITTTGASGEDITIDNQGGSVNIIATENISSAILIEADGGILEGITLHADQGTGDESIFLSSDVGGITLNAADSSVDIEAPDAASGDIALSAGDDMTLTSTGLMTLAHSESLAIGQVHSSKYVTVYAAHASLSAAQSGGVFVTTAGGGSQFFQLPAASAGLIYYFVDISATAADDLMVKPTAGDSVADAAVSKMYASVGDEINTGLTVVAVNSGSWSVISSNGTWTPTQLP
ncbi:hypothetical protein KAR91_14470, partial [Candidatus Pacearchaeota archaeon]|nr:hypothetical protein [Candidatus Pacearchaeota archaeon]